MKKKLYDIDYKKQAVQLCKEEEQTIAQTARNLGISYKTLHRWCNEYKQSKGSGFVGFGNIKPENQDLLALKRHNRELEEELAILKKALPLLGLCLVAGILFTLILLYTKKSTINGAFLQYP